MRRFLCVLLLAGCGEPDPLDDAGVDARATDAGRECAPIDNMGVDVATSAFWAGQRFNPNSEWLALIRYAGLSPVGLSVLDFCGESIAEVDTTDIVGTFIAWADERTMYYGGGDGIMQVSIGGGGGTPSMLLADADTFDLAPDSDRIVFSRGGNLFLYEITSSTETNLAMTGTFPRFSPNETHIAFLDDDRLKLLELSSSTLQDGPEIGSHAFQPFDFGADDFQLAVVVPGGIDAVTFDPVEGLLQMRVADVGDVIDVDVSPSVRFMTFRRNGEQGFTLYGVPERPDPPPALDAGVDAGT